VKIKVFARGADLLGLDTLLYNMLSSTLMKTKTAKLSSSKDNVRLKAFQDPLSGYWFYSFEYGWCQYGPTRGYHSRGEALEAARWHLLSL
jgi:hypothetical protein